VTGPGPAGPVDSEAEVRALPAVQAIRAACRANPARHADADNARMITRACDTAGVALGAYDRRIVAWLAGWEPQTCAVVAAMISRTAAAKGD
jgi:hypothetical protein